MKPRYLDKGSHKGQNHRPSPPPIPQAFHSVLDVNKSLAGSLIKWESPDALLSCPQGDFQSVCVYTQVCATPL